MRNQVPQVFFKLDAGDLMLVSSYEFVDIIFCKYLDILEIISYCRSDPFTLIDLDFLPNSYMIACTNTQGFEEGENCASTITVKHLDLLHILGSDMILFGSDMILIDSGFKFQ